MRLSIASSLRNATAPYVMMRSVSGHTRRVALDAIHLGRRPKGLQLFARHFASRLELEFEDDGSEKKYLRKPGRGSWARGSFIRERFGDTIEENYEFLDLPIGNGGMSQVKEALHKRTGKQVAVKMVQKSQSDDHVQALVREAEFLKTTDHPNIVRLFEVFEDEEKLCLVLQFCRGGNLEDRMRFLHNSRQGFDQAELKDLTISMLQAISYCHSSSIVHRDIKPSNFMFAPRLKLVDFGVSGVVPRSDSSTRFLQVKTGTNGYIAPEIMSGRLYGPSADMFSLGATLMHMITGKRPVWLAALGQYHFPKTKVKTILSADGLDFCSSLLHKDPSKRPTASQALKHPWLAQEKENEFKHLDENRTNHLKRHRLRSKLQRLARTNYVVHNSLWEEHLVGIESEFCSMVQSSIGEINYKELQASLRLPNSLEAATLLHGLDAHGTGTIAFSEWLVASCPDDVFQDPAAARRAFETLDSDGDGFISAKDLYSVLPGVFSEEEILSEMEQHDMDGDGYICFKDFRELLAKEAPGVPLHM